MSLPRVPTLEGGLEGALKMLGSSVSGGWTVKACGHQISWIFARLNTYVMIFAWNAFDHGGSQG